MVRTIRPIDSPDPGLERIAKANGFSLYAGKKKRKRGRM
jgi:hypothetical protein